MITITDRMKRMGMAFRSMNTFSVPIFLSLSFVSYGYILALPSYAAAAGDVIPYTVDANTVALDHLDGATSASILAYRETGAACGSEKPSATPNYAYGPGPAGLSQALNLDPPTGEPAGSATYLIYPDGQLLSQTNGTIELWTYLTSYGTGRSLAQQGQFPGSCAGWTFGMHVSATGQLQAGAWAAFNMNSGATKVPLFTWTHVAATWGSTGAKLYMNGKLVGSDTNTGLPAGGYGGSVLIDLSAAAGTRTDEIRISNIQRTSFNLPTKQLTVIKSGTGSGEVAPNSGSLTWSGNQGTGAYSSGAVVVLTATPAAHSGLTSWTGCTSVSGNTCNVAMNGAKKVTGTFTTDPKYSITVTKAGTGIGTVTSNLGGITCPGDCSEPYWKNTIVVLTAAPSAGSTFSGWRGACTGLQNTCNLTMKAAKSVAATFIPNPVLTVVKAGAGTGSITSTDSGITCGNVDTPDCTETYTEVKTITLTAIPAAHSSLTSWAGCTSVNGNTCNVTMNGVKKVTGTFTTDPKYSITVTKAGTGIGTVTSNLGGITCPGDCSEPYWTNTIVVLTAAPSAGSTFSGWRGACTGLQNTCNLTMTAAKSAAATFIPNPVLTVVKAGAGTGSITSTDSGINCGNVDTPDCTETYTEVKTITLTATPALHSSLTSWAGCTSVSGNTCNVAMNGAKKVTGTFTTDPKYPITVTKSGTGVGTVTSNPGGITCPGDCTETYWKHNIVVLTAAPSAGSTFNGWRGACTGLQSTCNLTMTAAKSVAATFIPNPVLTVVKAGAGTGSITSTDSGINCGNVDTPDCTETYTEVKTITLTATPALHSSLTSWAGCTSVSGNTCNVAMNGAKKVTGTFTIDPKYPITVTKAGTGIGTVTSNLGGITCPGDCNEPYWKNQVVTLTATPSASAIFSGWSGACAGTQSTCSLTMTAAKTVKATFVALSTLNVLSGASWSLDRPVTAATITWINKEGDSIQTEAISGEIQIIADSAKLTASDVQNIVLAHGGTIFAKLPALGLYWAKIPDGTEASFISSLQGLVADVFPNHILENKYLTQGLIMPTTYTYSEANPTPVKVSSGNVIIDNFSNPMCLNCPCLKCPPSEGQDAIYILKNSITNKVEIGENGFYTTTDKAKAATHGDIVNLYSTNNYTLTTSNASSNLCDTAECSNPADLKYGVYAESMYLRIAAVIKGSAAIPMAATINFSQGPGEYKYGQREGWETYNQTNNWSSLSSILRVLDSRVSDTDNAMIVMAAGNGSANITKMLITEQMLNPKEFEKVIMVGALDAAGNIADYSNYSEDRLGMLYVKAGPIPGTSFAAPQVHYLINKIREARPDLTPGQIRQIIFDVRLSLLKSVPIPNDPNNTMEVPVITDPLSQSTVDTALMVADDLFPPTIFTLSVSKAGTGSGTVSANPSGLSYPAGTSVTLTASPGSKSRFSGWSGACSGTQSTCTLTMTAPKSVTATFTATSATCSIDIEGNVDTCTEISLDDTVIKDTCCGNLFTTQIISFGSHTLSFTNRCGWNGFAYIDIWTHSYSGGCTISPSSFELTDYFDNITTREFTIY